MKTAVVTDSTAYIPPGKAAPPFTDSYQNILAKAIADGIDEYFAIY
ncbi:hypothetical protein [Neobacillus ginsengisoli]|uniref:DegV family protein n=1 Tax=Neobacillus ginsengisoli TaxID=904295 RepID=A0ABT9XU27_9BACI|nr:hypothetical protein [Neobacillus ginsengisoli]MDQ0199058.1 hypothetical protein [Neobacillus ginsengisoli]